MAEQGKVTKAKSIDEAPQVAIPSLARGSGTSGECDMSTISGGSGVAAAAASSTSTDPSGLGYWPLRGDFDTEYENEAELIIADMDIKEADSPETKALKLQILEIYNSRLDARVARKRLIAEWGLGDLRRLAETERRQTRDERDLHAALRPLARFSRSRHDHELFIRLLRDERKLRERLRLLSEYRAMGLKTRREIKGYEEDRRRREEALKRSTGGTSGGAGYTGSTVELTSLREMVAAEINTKIKIHKRSKKSPRMDPLRPSASTLTAVEDMPSGHQRTTSASLDLDGKGPRTAEALTPFASDNFQGVKQPPLPHRTSGDLRPRRSHEGSGAVDGTCSATETALGSLGLGEVFLHEQEREFISTLNIAPASYFIIKHMVLTEMAKQEDQMARTDTPLAPAHQTEDRSAAVGDQLHCQSGSLPPPAHSARSKRRRGSADSTTESPSGDGREGSVEADISQSNGENEIHENSHEPRDAERCGPHNGSYETWLRIDAQRLATLVDFVVSRFDVYQPSQ